MEVVKRASMWVPFLVASLCFALPLCCSSVTNREGLYGYGGAVPIGAPSPVAGDSVAHAMNSRPRVQNITLIFVVGVSVCLAIFIISYCIAYRTIMVRQGAWVEHYDLFRSRARGIPATAQPSNAASSRLDDDGGLNASFVRNSLRSVQYRPAMEKKKQQAALQVMWAKECAVCLAEFEDGEEMKALPVCGHCFHETCITKWLRSRSTCPICRLSLRKPARPPPDHHAQLAADPPIDEGGASGPSRGLHVAVDI